jgi:DNA repair protein RadC
LIAEFGSVAGILAAGAGAQARLLGAGHPAVAHLGMIREVMLSVLRARAAKGPVLGTAQALIDYLFADMAHLPSERLRVLFLNSRNHLLADEIMGDGSVNEIAIHPRVIMKRALELGATALILVHNHPSGDPDPSQGDIDTTRRIAEAARPLDICIHDHVIVAGSGWSSFRVLGLI